MVCDNDSIERKIWRILHAEATTEEIREFAGWLEKPDNKRYFEQLKELWNMTSGPVATPEEVEAELVHFKDFMHAHRKKAMGKRVLPVFKWAGWVAACALPVAVCLYWLMQTGPSANVKREYPVAAITPGGTKAILTTAGGEVIPLDSARRLEMKIAPGRRMTETGMTVEAQDYAAQDAPEQYDRLTVPRGGEFQVTLSDGTQVYLNAASEFKYPVNFGKKERVVYLSGEAYFEVHKDAERPFYVLTENVSIRVYGTCFNVNTRSEGKTRTVLVEGNIGIKGRESDGQEYRLKPSQLADFNASGQLEELREVNTKPYIAWKEGLFLFDGESLEEILNRLALWYDVDVVYVHPEVKNYHFTGYMERYKQMEVILRAIRKMVGVKFSVEGRTVFVSK